MFTDEVFALFFIMLRAKSLPHDTIGINRFFELLACIINIGHAACHARAKVVTNRAEDDGNAPCHIFTAIRTAALNHSDSPRVPHSKAFASTTRSHQRAFRRSVKARITNDSTVMRVNRSLTLRRDNDFSPRKSFTHIIIGITIDDQAKALHGKRAKRLPCRPAQTHCQLTIRDAVGAESLINVRTRPCSNSAMCVLYAIRKIELLAAFKKLIRICDNLRVQSIRHRHANGTRINNRLIVHFCQDWVQIQIIKILSTTAHLS